MENEEKVDNLEETKEEIVNTATPVENLDINTNVTTSENPEEPRVVGLDKEEKKKSKKGLVVLLIIILIAAGCGAYFFLFNKPVEKETAKTKAKEVKSEYRITGNDLQAFDLYFLQLENKEVNKVYSPLSIKYALEMLGEGSKGDTKDQIDAVIGEYQAKKYTNSKHMSFANAMFIRDSFKDSVKEDYTKNLTDKYNAEVKYADFNSAKPMNDWVSEKTFGLIKDLFDDKTVSTENFELINALAIDMNWKNRIHASTAPLPEGMNQKRYGVKYNHEKYYDSIGMIEGEDGYPTMKFNNVEGIKSVMVGASFNRYDIIKDKGEDNIRKTVTEDYQKYLNENPDQKEACPSVKEYVDQYIVEIGENYKRADVSTDYYISDNENEKIFAKDLQTYDGITLQYIGIMPKKDNLTTYVNKLDVNNVSKIMKEMKEVKYENFKEGVITQIKGNIPLFEYDYKLNLMEDLSELGIKDAFDINKADLSNMVNGKQFINSANHKANIEFSNDGIKAAAATAMGGAGAATACGYDYEYEVPVEKIDVTFDKPYMYIIRDKDSGEVWFVGTVYEPIRK